MLDTIRRYLQGIAAQKDRYAVQRIVDPIGDRMSSQAITSAGLVISAGGATTAKIGAADFYATANGVTVKIASGTVLPALTGINAPAGGFNIACFFIDSAGTVTVLGGTSAATLGGVVWPQFPVRKALIGSLLITYASPFVGGTTPLDTATTVYFYDAGGAFDPTILIG